MATHDKDQKLNRVVQDAEDLLQQLDGLNVADKPQSEDAKSTTKSGSSIQRTVKETKAAGEVKKLLAVVGMLSGLIGFFIILAWIASHNNIANKQDNEQRVQETSPVQPSSTTEVEQPRASNTLPDAKPSAPPASEAYFHGIDLPITNRLCNRKGTFCINDLAKIVKSEGGTASYSYTDTVNGERVDIIGQISIANLEKSSDGTPTFTFSFKDDQAQTTPGWAASGFFSLDQDSSRPGILVRFKTTESFGPKTPVGLENTSFLFPN